MTDTTTHEREAQLPTTRRGVLFATAGSVVASGRASANIGGDGGTDEWPPAVVENVERIRWRSGEGTVDARRIEFREDGGFFGLIGGSETIGVSRVHIA